VRDRFHNTHVGRQIRRQGSESVDGGLPRELRPAPRQEPTKTQLREMLAEAWANTARLTIKRAPVVKRSRP
jgi:hypothetical protein